MEVTNQSTQLITKGLGLTLITECTQLIFDLRWAILLGIILIFTDFWFGVSESKYLKKEIRKSRAGRRSLNKCMDYFCYIIFGAVAGKAIGDPYGLDPKVISITLLLLCYCFEIDSIYGHICTIHGIKKRYSVWKILFYLLTFKFKALGEAFKSMSEQSKNNKK